MNRSVIDTNPAALRAAYGIRFHHFHDLRGRLVATIVTEPILNSFNADGDPMVAVAAAILFQGADPIPALMQDIEAAVRAQKQELAELLLGDALDAVEEGRVKEADVPSRARGREVAIGRLFNVDVEAVILSEPDLKEEIANRTILRHFPGGKNLRLRPRAPFTARGTR